MDKKTDQIEQISSILQPLMNEKTKLEEQEKKPLFLDFGINYDIPIEISIFTKVSPLLMDRVEPVLLSKRNMLREMYLQIQDSGIKGIMSLEEYKEHIDNDGTEEEWYGYMTKQAKAYYEQKKLPKDTVFTKNEFDMYFKHGYNKPQKREDNRFNIELLKVLINFMMTRKDTAGNQKIEIHELLKSPADSEFWQNQNMEEIERICSRFRKKYCN